MSSPQNQAIDPTFMEVMGFMKGMKGLIWEQAQLPAEKLFRAHAILSQPDARKQKKARKQARELLESALAAFQEIHQQAKTVPLPKEGPPLLRAPLGMARSYAVDKVSDCMKACEALLSYGKSWDDSLLVQARELMEPLSR